MAENRKEQPQPGNKQDIFQKLDEAYADSNLEDQLIVFWNRHKNQVVEWHSDTLDLEVQIENSNPPYVFFLDQESGEEFEDYVPEPETIRPFIGRIIG